jgi:cystathionine beta-lyase family protein involved in aluminum resistance
LTSKFSELLDEFYLVSISSLKSISTAVNFAKECYSLVVEDSDPVDPQVQVAAGVLINILTRKMLLRELIETR